MSNLLARYAENAFWMARYMERAENLARTLDVNETFARDSQGTQEWLAIVWLNADEKSFFAKHAEASAQAVLEFYLLDRDNPTSVQSVIRAARENGRSLRHLISTELWSHLNVFYERLHTLGADDIALANLSRLCTTIKENCQTHMGIAEGTLHRDESWHFYSIGRYVERADQTTRLLDMKYHILQPALDSPERFLDVSQWNALLRSVGGYHAFRRVHPRGIRREDVAAFLLLNPDFPRSVSLCVGEVERMVRDLGNRFGLKLGRRLRAALRRLTVAIEEDSAEAIAQGSVHAFIDRLQAGLADVTDELGTAYFGAALGQPPARVAE